MRLYKYERTFSALAKHRVVVAVEVLAVEVVAVEVVAVEVVAVEVAAVVTFEVAVEKAIVVVVVETGFSLVLVLEPCIPGIDSFCNFLTEELVLFTMNTCVHFVGVIIARELA